MNGADRGEWVIYLSKNQTALYEDNKKNEFK